MSSLEMGVRLSFSIKYRSQHYLLIFFFLTGNSYLCQMIKLHLFGLLLFHAVD